jgi:hypothetical protein
VTEPWHSRFVSEQAQHSRLLDHPMSLDERIDNVPAGYTSPSFHPHRNTALLHVDQVIGNHETIASYCTAWGPPLFMLEPTTLTIHPLPFWQDAEKGRQWRSRFAQTLNVPKRTPSPLRSLRPCWTAFLSILHGVLLLF